MPEKSVLKFMKSDLSESKIFIKIISVQSLKDV